MPFCVNLISVTNVGMGLLPSLMGRRRYPALSFTGGLSVNARRSRVSDRNGDGHRASPRALLGWRSPAACDSSAGTTGGYRDPYWRGVPNAEGAGREEPGTA